MINDVWPFCFLDSLLDFGLHGRTLSGGDRVYFWKVRLGSFVDEHMNTVYYKTDVYDFHVIDLPVDLSSFLVVNSGSWDETLLATEAGVSVSEVVRWSSSVNKWERAKFLAYALALDYIPNDAVVPRVASFVHSRRSLARVLMEVWCMSDYLLNAANFSPGGKAVSRMSVSNLSRLSDPLNRPLVNGSAFGKVYEVVDSDPATGTVRYRRPVAGSSVIEGSASSDLVPEDKFYVY
jgi:hypothetical protein